jgi:serine/threonine-protein kinase
MNGGILHGKYALDHKLGQGGMAEVFLGRTVGVEGFSRPVALKRVLSEYANNQEFVQLFVQEAQLTSQLQHDNLISVVDFFRDDDSRLCLVMEFVDGPDLAKLVDTGALSIALILYLASEILMGLDYIHDLPMNADGRRGLVHRDLSPNNVLLSWNGAVKISDFGIAKLRTATQVTASLMIKGKPAYMSPEQANGQPLDGRSDLFAVGIMLYEMICLQPLFGGATHEETLTRLLVRPIPDIRQMRPDCPKDLARIISSLLIRDLDKRVPTARDAWRAIVACADYPRDGRNLLTATLAERFAGQAKIGARHVSHGSAVDPTRVPAIETPRVRNVRTATTPGALRPSSERRWRWLVAMTVLALSLIVGVSVLVTDHRAPGVAAAPALPSHAASAAHPPSTAGAPAVSSATGASAPPNLPPPVPTAPAAAEPLSTSGNAAADPRTARPPIPSPLPPAHDDGSRPRPPEHRPAARSDGIRELKL